MKRTETVTFTNMCMICDGDKVLVQNRNDPDWPGITFPGGHVEKGESFVDAVVREVLEETGLTIFAPRLVGVKDWYGDVLFTAPLVAVNVAHPMMQEILAELKTEGRKFAFLCGHDSNIGSVLAAIGANDYSLPETIEKKTPIGSKLVIEKWSGNDGKMYAAVNLCYQSLDQLRHLQLLSLENTPTVFSVPIEGLTANEDGLYLLDDLTARLGERIAQYDELLTGIASTRAVAQNDGTRAKIFKLDGTPADEETRGIVIDNGKKKVVK